MPNANIELFSPRANIFGYLKVSPLQVLHRFAPWLADKTHCFHPSERLLEYAFIHENIPFGGEGNILDVGSGSSLLPFELASKGYRVWSIDLKSGYRSSVRYDNFTFVQADIRKSDFPDVFFNIVTAVSSIEHVGFDGSNPKPAGDKDALQEILRILKTGGKLLMTVPFGKQGTYSIKGHATWRVYNPLSLTELLDGFDVEKKQFALLRNESWKPASLEEAQAVDSLSQPKWYSSRAVAMVVARKSSVAKAL